MRHLSYLHLSLIAGILGFPAVALAQTAAVPLVLTIGGLLLHLVLPLLASASGALITVILAKEALGFGWLKAHAKSAKQIAAIDTLEHLAATATQSVLSKVAADVGASKSIAEIASDALTALKVSVPEDQLLSLAGQVAGIGVDELQWYLTHLLTAHAQQATAGKVLSLPLGASDGMTTAQKRNMVAGAGVVP